MQIQRQIFQVTERRLVIEVPESFLNRRVEIITKPLDEDAVSHKTGPKRRPHPKIAGKGKTLGDLVSPIVDETDWECLK